MVTSFILAFSGLSIQAQVASILAETDIRFKPYFFARIIQSILAPIFTFIFWKPFYEKVSSFSPMQKIYLSFYRIILLYCMTFGHLLYTTDQYLHYFVYMYMSSYYFSEQQRKTPFTLTGFETFF